MKYKKVNDMLVYTVMVALEEVATEDPYNQDNMPKNDIVRLRGLEERARKYHGFVAMMPEMVSVGVIFNDKKDSEDFYEEIKEEMHNKCFKTDRFMKLDGTLNIREEDDKA